VPTSPFFFFFPSLPPYGLKVVEEILPFYKDASPGANAVFPPLLPPFFSFFSEKKRVRRTARQPFSLLSFPFLEEGKKRSERSPLFLYSLLFSFFSPFFSELDESGIQLLHGKLFFFPPPSPFFPLLRALEVLRDPKSEARVSCLPLSPPPLPSFTVDRR